MSYIICALTSLLEGKELITDQNLESKNMESVYSPKKLNSNQNFSNETICDKFYFFPSLFLWENLFFLLLQFSVF